jgi:hypothetical protein
LANIGLGEQDSIAAIEDQERAASFYRGVANFAKDKGVNISVITIKGTDCKMENLGILADVTGGQVNIVEPLKLVTEFSSILTDEVIATHVSASLILNKGFKIRDLSSAETSTSVQEIGNVTKDSEITFEYGVKHGVEIKEEEVPFQVQITYRKMNGMKCIRVITTWKPVTKDRDLAEVQSNINVLGANVARQTYVIFWRFYWRSKFLL